MERREIPKKLKVEIIEFFYDIEMRQKELEFTQEAYRILKAPKFKPRKRF